MAAEQSISCPSCGKKIPLSRALRTEIEASVKEDYERQLTEEVERARKQAGKDAEKKAAREMTALKDELEAQAKDLEQARHTELAMRKRERELERKHQELELTVARKLDDERNRIVADTQTRAAEQHRLKDAEKERQLTDMRRQIEDLKRKAEQGSQQLQGEAGEGELETRRASVGRTCTRSSSTRAVPGPARSSGSARTPGTGATAGLRN